MERGCAGRSRGTSGWRGPSDPGLESAQHEDVDWCAQPSKGGNAEARESVEWVRARSRARGRESRKVANSVESTWIEKSGRDPPKEPRGSRYHVKALCRKVEPEREEASADLPGRAAEAPGQGRVEAQSTEGRRGVAGAVGGLKCL